jgi:hypothetical protein
VTESELRNDDDVEAILKLAINQASVDGGRSLRERLNASAQELGLTPEQIQEAERIYFNKEREAQELAEFKSLQRRGFLGHLTAYIIVNTSLALMNILSVGNIGWAIWPIAGWGIGLAFNFVGSMVTSSQAFQEEFESWKKKRRKRANDGETPTLNG